MRDSFAMDNARHNDRYESKKAFMKLSRTGFFLFIAIFLCSLVAVSLLVYNFAVCPQEDPQLSENHHHHHIRPELLNPTLSLTTTPQNNEISSQKVKKDLRLPRSIKPVSYDVVLLPFLVADNFTFNGEIAIKVHIVETCKNITLHSMSLIVNWSYSQIHRLDGDDQPIENMSIVNQYFSEEKQFLVIETKNELEAGSFYVVKLKFIGVIKDNLQGFYKSSYNVGSETKWIASTQFQATDARRAFPCMDEPHLKAKFKITLGRPEDMKTISNMPLEKSVLYNEKLKPVDGFIWDIYQESVPMSTYLVAFVVCDFVKKSNGKNFSVWTRKDAIRSMDYSLSVGPRALSFLEDFFGIEYPLPKTDMIAIPDFAFGAMENWGLITFRETAMLYEPGVSAIGKKMTVAAVICHEIAHQWFGNLVTPSWWGDLWLNEGFATYMEHICVDHLEPSWKSNDLFVVNELHQVFALDALTTSHKISIEVSNPDQINEIFDSISYSKGASIIRSMENFLTLDVFKRGVTNYLNQFLYQSATQDDLWAALTLEAKKSGIFDDEMSVKEIMDGWTLQTGFPYITVSRSHEDDKISLEQRRFILMETNSTEDEESNEKEDKDPLWWVPITFTTKNELNFNNTKPSHWMKAEKTIEIGHVFDENDWVLINLQVTGYYRVNYDIKNWKLIIDHLNDAQRYHEIAQSNRAQLIDDAMNLARADLLDYTIALDVTKYLNHERDYVPWKTAINNLLYIDSMLIRTPDYDKMKKYFAAKIENIYDRLGFEDTGDVLTMLNRYEILKAACHLGMKDCVSNAIAKFHMWIHEANPDVNNPISPNLKFIVYCTAIKHGDSDEWDFAWDRFMNTTISSEKETLMQALGCSREHWILSRYLERSIASDGPIRKQDTFRVFSSVSNNAWGQAIAFNFIRENWKRLRNHFEGSSLSSLNSLIKFSTKKLTDRTQLEALKNFDDNELKEGRTLKQAIERAEANIAWLDKNYKKIISWLGENSE